MVIDFIASWLGAAGGSWIVYNLLCLVLFKRIEKKILPYIAFIGSVIIILAITNYTVGIKEGFTLYIPFLFVWLVVELARVNKQKRKSTDESNDDKRTVV